MTHSSDARIQIVREFSSRRELVFQAMSDPKYVQRWFYPRRDVFLTVEQIDFTVRGQYRFHYQFPDGTTLRVCGQFLRIVRPELVAYTWTWEAPDPHADVQTLVTWQLEDIPTGTRLIVTHKQLPDDYLPMFKPGWSQTIQHFAELLDSINDEGHDR